MEDDLETTLSKLNLKIQELENEKRRLLARSLAIPHNPIVLSYIKKNALVKKHLLSERVWMMGHPANPHTLLEDGLIIQVLLSDGEYQMGRKEQFFGPEAETEGRAVLMWTTDQWIVLDNREISPVHAKCPVEVRYIAGQTEEAFGEQVEWSPSKHQFVTHWRPGLVHQWDNQEEIPDFDAELGFVKSS